MAKAAVTASPRSGAQPSAQNAQMRALLTLREWIVSGELKGGERISELPLVERLGVSRTPVRAALQRLEQEGLLQALSGGGYVVREFTTQDIADAIELRGVLEGVGARWAAERGVSEQALADARDALTALDEVLRVPGLSDETLNAYGVLNTAFHQALMAMANSPALSQEYERLAALPFAGPSSFVLGQSAAEHTFHRFVVAQDHHWQVLEAIAARQGARAESLMREHAAIAQRNLQASLDQQNTSRTHGRAGTSAVARMVRAASS